jgi:peptide/nickel transport system substrate-binding protein
MQGEGRRAGADERRRGRYRAASALLAAAAVTGAAVAGCGGSSGGSGSAATGGDAGGAVRADAGLSVRLNGDYDTLNPFLSTNYSGHQLALMTYDRIVALDDSGKVVPYVASSWTEKPDSVLLHIRRDVTCEDGTKITPTDVKRSLDYLGNPRTGAFSASLILGPNGFRTTADDRAGTVLIALGKPYAYLLRELSQAYVICGAGLKQPAALKTKTFGSGPYQLTQSARGNQYVYTRRADWRWGPRGVTSSTAGLPKTVTFKVISSETTAANLLIGGGLDIGMVTGRDVDRLKATPSLSHVPADVGGGANSLVFNQAPGHPGADPQVRRALALAVDNVAYDKADSFGNAKVLSTLYDPQTVCHDPADAKAAIPYDVEQAREALRQAGWVPDSSGKVHKDGRPLVVNVVGLTVQNNGPAYLQTAFDAIGVTTKVQQLDQAAWGNIVFGTGSWDATVYVFAGLFAIPQFSAVQASGPAPPAGVNVGSIRNRAFEQLAARAGVATGDAACPLWQEGERELMAAADVKPLNTLHFDAFGRKASFTTFGGVAIDPLTLRALR